MLLGAAGAAALKRLTAFAIRRATEEPLDPALAFAGAFTAAFFTGLRAALAGLGLAFAAGLAAALRAGAALAVAGLAVAARRLAFAAGVLGLAAALGLLERARWLSTIAHSASVRLAGLLP